VKGNLRPHFHKIYPLEKATTALNDLMNRKVVGKAVVVMSKDIKKPTFKAPKAEKIFKVKQQGNTLIFKNLAQLKQYEGKEIGVSTWQTITQTDINTFGKVTDDEQWIHIDEAMAKEKSPFGTTVAHGFMVLSFASKFFFELFKVESVKMGLNYGANRVRFTSPILSGCRVRMKATLKSVEDMPQNGVKLLMEVVFEMEGAKKPVCVAELLSVLYE
jgi:acyl dehydratase